MNTATTQLNKIKTDYEKQEEFNLSLQTENEQLENDLKTHHKEFKLLKKQINELKDKIVSLERDNLLKEGKIQQLDETKKDLQERYNDLKQDFREQQKWKHTEQAK